MKIPEGAVEQWQTSLGHTGATGLLGSSRAAVVEDGSNVCVIGSTSVALLTAAVLRHKDCTVVFAGFDETSVAEAKALGCTALQFEPT